LNAPSHITQKRKTHRQPIPVQAVCLLQKIQTEFPGNRGVLGDKQDKVISNNAMLNVAKSCGKITVHGFRTTLGSWCAENVIDERVKELFLAHQPEYLDSAYQRSDLLEPWRFVLQKYADFVTGGLEQGFQNHV
jgi:integrase